MNFQNLWKVAVDAPIPEALTYSFTEPLSRGQLVNVPLGKRKVKGLVLGPAEDSPDFEVKSIDSIDTDYEALPEAFVKWLGWLSQYYFHPPGQVASSAFPPLRKAEKTRKSKRPPVIPQLEADREHHLTEEQRTCFEAISKYENFSTHLIFGVTGSGKTEIYLRLLEEMLAKGKRGLVLVPEISLTPQLIQRFARRFGAENIAALHSQLTDRERTNQWWDIVEGRKSILIGARSALFCPIQDLGLIVVDEEHEPSYKQEEKLKYNGRDAAVVLGKFMDCPVLLGSATPSLESWKNVQDGKYVLHTLKNRVAGRALPAVEIVDLRRTKEDSKEQSVRHQKILLPFWLSPELHMKMTETLERREQVALFLNRRGVAQMVVCPACGHTRECPNCDISLTLHGHSHLVCHYCDYHENFKSRCPDCKEGELEAIGLGTELLERDLAQLYPDKKIARADRDEIQNRADLEEMIEQMESGGIDILVGTQMIAKGLDFPKLKLVGLVLADVGFNLPDFRATERSFQLITQMSGRSGRHVAEGESPGLVIVQTFNTEHDSLTFASRHDFEGFAAHELQTRAQLNYPPVGRLVSFRIQGNRQGRVEEAARLLARRAHALKAQNPRYASVEVLGPAEAPLAKLRGVFRYHLLIKASGSAIINTFSRQLLGDEDWAPAGTKILVDIDPMSLL